jgi:hypothetical protein
LEITLKIHQIFALIDVDYSSVFSKGNQKDELDLETLKRFQKHFYEI